MRFYEFSRKITHLSLSEYSSLKGLYGPFVFETEKLLKEMEAFEDVGEFLVTIQIMKTVLTSEHIINVSGSKHDLDSACSFLLEFRNLLELGGTLDTGPFRYTRFQRKDLHKYHCNIYCTLRAYLDEYFLITEEEMQKLQLSQIVPGSDEYNLWMKCTGGSHQLFVQWNILFQELSSIFKLEYSAQISDEELLLKRVVDNSGIGFASIKSFDNFLKSFGPLKESLSNLQKMHKFPWFYGFLSSDEGRLALSRGKVKPGLYLVRFSNSRSDCFALQYLVAADEKSTKSTSKNIIIHGEQNVKCILNSVQIQCLSPNLIAIQETTADGTCVKKEFPSVEQLIRHYEEKRVLTKPLVNDLVSQPYFHYGITQSEIKELLTGKPPGFFLIHLSMVQEKSEGEELRVDFSFVNKNWDTATLSLDKLPLSGKKYSIISNPAFEGEMATTTFENISSFIDQHSEYFKYGLSVGSASLDMPAGFDTLRVAPVFQEDEDEEAYYDEKVMGPTPDCYQKYPYNGCSTNGVQEEGPIFGKSVSNYPKGTLAHNIWCDAFKCLVIDNTALIALCDGCGWGNKSRNAAEIGTTEALKYIRREIEANRSTSFLSVADISKFILGSFAKAHKCIKEAEVPGTTTMLVGMIAKLNSVAPYEYGFVCVSLGDCKAFHWERKTGIVRDITYGNRQNTNDPCDCGGRLGPWLAKGEADLRNLSVFFWPCQADDIVFAVSDGIHDNFDPEILGKSPQQVDPECDAASWSDLSHKKCEKLKSKFMCKQIGELLNGENNKLVDKASPKEFANNLIAYTTFVTSKSRSYMELDEKAMEPKNYVEFPGKMDHATCVAARVGPYIPSTLVRGPKKPPSYRASAKDKKSAKEMSLSSSERRSGATERVNYSELGRKELDEIKDSSGFASDPFGFFSHILTPAREEASCLARYRLFQGDCEDYLRCQVFRYLPGTMTEMPTNETTVNRLQKIIMNPTNRNSLTAGHNLHNPFTASSEPVFNENTDNGPTTNSYVRSSFATSAVCDFFRSGGALPMSVTTNALRLNPCYSNIMISATQNIGVLLCFDGDPTEKDLMDQVRTEIMSVFKQNESQQASVEACFKALCLTPLKRVHHKFKEDIRLSCTIAMTLMVNHLEIGAKSREGQHALLCANYGSNKLFYWSHHNRTLTDLTPYNCPVAPNMKESKGVDPTPTLGNAMGAGRGKRVMDSLKLVLIKCEDPRDVIITMNALLYDAFDPQGKLPKELSKQLNTKADTWAQLPYWEPTRAKERMDALRRRLIVPNDHTLPLEQEASIRSLMAEVKKKKGMDGMKSSGEITKKIKGKDSKGAKTLGAYTACCQMFRVSQTDGLASFNITQKNIKSSQLAKSSKKPQPSDSSREVFEVTHYNMGIVGK